MLDVVDFYLTAAWMTAAALGGLNVAVNPAAAWARLRDAARGLDRRLKGE